jgi:4-hydroxy-tetrahydrodipicolinate reductase
MGAEVLRLALDDGRFAVTAVVDRDGAGSPSTPLPPGCVITSELERGLGECEVYVDFTVPAVSAAAAAAATRLGGRAAIIGTTGLSAEAQVAITALASHSPVVVAANFSVGVAVLTALARKAASVLSADWDCEIVETHHRDKRDAPSGTALELVRALAEARGGSAPDVSHGRSGDVGARLQGQIAVHAVRGGTVVGEHTVLLLGNHERIELTHCAQDRSIFARGALRAASWASGRRPGRYGLDDVLGG